MKKYILALGVILLMTNAKLWCQEIDNIENTGVKIEVYDFDQLMPLLKADDDKTYIVNFWATWCKPCIEELPFFEKLETANQNKIKVILVSLDFPNKLESQVKPFVVKKGLKSQVVLLDDPYENEWIPKVDPSWSGAIPATLIFNKTKRSFYEGSFTEESLNKELLKFI